MIYIVEIQKYYLYLLWFLFILFFLLSLGFLIFILSKKSKNKFYWRKNANLFSRLAHDLKTPISAIEGYTYLSKENIKDSEKLKSYLDKIENSSKYMQSLINDTFEMTKENKKNAESSFVRVNLLELIHLCVDNVNPYLLSRKINFKREFNLTNPWVMADGLRLAQVLTNLLMNAIKYTDEFGEISFKVIENEKSINFSSYTFIIQDNGCGMSKEFQKRMFEAYTEEHRLKTDIPSSGLGLYIVKQLIEQMRGEILVESEENIGSCFTIKLELHHFINE